MTSQQIHRIVFLRGLMRGITSLNTTDNQVHRFKDYIDGRTVGLSEIHYREGRKPIIAYRLRSIHNDVLNGKA